MNKVIWEGWTAQDFVNDLEPTFDCIMSNGSWHRPFSDDAELKRWCMENQPYYKKHVPAVFNYFKNKMRRYQS